MKIKSRISSELYEAENCVFLKNPTQAALYLKHELNLIDCFWDNGKICFVFDKCESRPFYKMWNEHKLV